MSSLLTSSGVLDEADCESGGGSEQGHGEDAEDAIERLLYAPCSVQLAVGTGNLLTAGTSERANFRRDGAGCKREIVG